MIGGGARAIFASALVLACSGAPDDGATLRIWAMGREGEVLSELVPEFERLHPGLASTKGPA